MKHFKRHITDQQICILTFDREGSSANIFDPETFAELNEQLDFIEQDKSLKGVVFESAKPTIFIAGADLKGFAKADFDEARLRELIRQGQSTFNRVAKLPIPTAAAIHGICVGGGFELTLACDYRIASNHKSTKIGLPEVQIGILPAWGGSTRLPRLIGLMKALEVILTGRQYPGAVARKRGFVDEVTFPETLRKVALQWVSKGKRYRTQKSPLLWDNWALARMVIESKSRHQVDTKTHGNYPAPLKALEVAVQGLGRSFEASLQLEEDAFVKLATTPIAKNLVNIFFLQERSKKLQPPAELFPDLKSESIEPKKNVQDETLMVIGAGVMGAGIAQWVSSKGSRVILKDVNPEMLARGMASIAKIYRDGVKRRTFTPIAARAGQDRIIPVFTNVPLHEVTFVIEAATEKLEMKKAIFSKLEDEVPENAVLATNTSALSIDELANSLKNPSRLVGMHFFNPVHRMQLVEVIYGSHTSGKAVEATLDFVKKIGKLPVLVKDSPGFLVNRILLPYLAEAIRLFQEGLDPMWIDHLMLQFGMPMGPLRLMDEVGFDTGQHVAKDLEARLPSAVPMNDVLVRFMERGWFGKKSGRGFYVYNSGSKGKETINPSLSQFQVAQKIQQPDLSKADLARDRMVLLMINEAARVLEEKVATHPEDVDFGMIMGTGWAPFRGGPLRYADQLGIKMVVERLTELESKVAPYFKPAHLLKEKAARNETFY